MASFFHQKQPLRNKFLFPPTQIGTINLLRYSTIEINKLKANFSSNLYAELKRKNISVSELSKLSGVSRSIISRYLGEEPAIPNTLQLVKISTALQCSVDVLIKNDAREDSSITTTLVDVSHAMSVDDKFHEMIAAIKNAGNKYIYYVPSGVPELLKTRDFLAGMNDKNTTVEVGRYFEALRNVIEFDFSGTIFIKEDLLYSLRDGRGDFMELSSRIREEQIQAVFNYSECKFPQIQVKCLPRNTQFISDVLMIGVDVAFHEFFDRIFSIRDHSILKNLQADLNEVSRSSLDLAFWAKTNDFFRTE